MMRKKRTVITVKTDRVVVIRGRRGQAQAWCNSCGRLATMITVEEAAAFARISSRAIYAWVDADGVHFTETSDGRLLICLDSIPPP